MSLSGKIVQNGVKSLKFFSPYFTELSLLLEVLKPFCTTLFMIAVFAFVKEVSPMTTTSTVEAVFGALYFGAGRGLGGLLGGLALEFLGSDQTFRCAKNVIAVVQVHESVF